MGNICSRHESADPKIKGKSFNATIRDEPNLWVSPVCCSFKLLISSNVNSSVWQNFAESCIIYITIVSVIDHLMCVLTSMISSRMDGQIIF